jgi:hypothetical protein
MSIELSEEQQRAQAEGSSQIMQIHLANYGYDTYA